MLTEFRPLRVRRKDRLVDPTTVLNNCWVPGQGKRGKARPDQAEPGNHIHIAPHLQPEHIPVCDSRLEDELGPALCLTLNDIQNSLQLILFRMHKYKQMGMPDCISTPLHSSPDQARLELPMPSYQRASISGLYEK